MPSSVRARIARSKTVKIAAVIALTCYLAFVVFQTVGQDQHEQLPWLVAREEGFKPFTIRQQVTPTNNVNKTMNQTQSTPTDKPEQKCTKTIASVAKYSKWFHERYKPNVKLFLDKADMGNYTEHIKLRLPFGFRSQNLTVFDQILQNENFTNPSVHGAKKKPGCIRCAVIGSGGILNGSGAGVEIDGHDYVFRLNRALTTGRFGEDVGKRTTFYTFFPESQRVKGVEDKNMVAFLALFKAYDVAYALKTIQGDTSPRYKVNNGSNGMKNPGIHPSKLKIIHPGFFKYVSEGYLGKKKRPTTGSVVVLLALHICDEVTIYGFGYDSRFTMHYYDSKFVTHTNKSTASHNVDNERGLWMKLHEEGVMRLFKRDL